MNNGEWPKTTLPSSIPVTQQPTSLPQDAPTSASTFNSDTVTILLQQLSGYGTFGQTDTTLPITTADVQPTISTSLNPTAPTSTLIEQFLASSAANNSFSQTQPVMTTDFLGGQIQTPTTTVESCISTENLQLLATLAALRAEKQNNQMMANTFAATSNQLSSLSLQNPVTLASSLPTAFSSFTLDPAVSVVQPTTSLSLESILLLLAASQQQQQANFCQPQQTPMTTTSSLELLRQLQAINNQPPPILSPNPLTTTTFDQPSSVTTTAAALVQKPSTITTFVPQQQATPVKRGRPRRFTEGAQTFSNSTFLQQQRQQKMAADAKPAETLAPVSKAFNRSQALPNGKTPTSADSCGVIANYLMSFNKAGL